MLFYVFVAWFAGGHPLKLPAGIRAGQRLCESMGTGGAGPKQGINRVEAGRMRTFVIKSGFGCLRGGVCTCFIIHEMGNV